MKETRKYKIIALSLVLLIFFIFGFMVMDSTEGILFDVVVIEHVHKNIDSSLLKIMEVISFIGAASFIIPLMAMILAYNMINKKYYSSKLLLLSTAGSWILNFLLKQIFHRTRPLEYSLVQQGGYSYPSGHTMVATTFYFTIAYLLTRNIGSKYKKLLIYIIATIFICLMGISRIYLGVHWPTDIIGGFIMGYIFYNVFISIIKE